MKTQIRKVMRMVFFFLFLCGLIAFSSSQINAKDWTEAQKEVWKTVEAFWEGIKQADEKAIIAIHHDDCVIWWATRRLPTDKYNIRLAYRKLISSPDEYKLVSYELDPQSIHIFGDVANVYYMYKWGTKKEPKYSSGRSMQTYKKQDNKWLLIGQMNALY